MCTRPKELTWNSSGVPRFDPTGYFFVEFVLVGANEQILTRTRADYSYTHSAGSLSYTLYPTIRTNDLTADDNRPLVLRFPRNVGCQGQYEASAYAAVVFTQGFETGMLPIYLRYGDEGNLHFLHPKSAYKTGALTGRDLYENFTVGVQGYHSAICAD